MTATQDVVVRVETQEQVLVITLDRPQVRNAVNAALAEQVAAALTRLDADPGLRVGVITGAGTTFCSGMDLKAFGGGQRASVPGRGFAGIVERPPIKPLIAAVEGAALAGGLEVVLACDLVVAGESAVFGLPEVQRGLIAAAGGLLRLPARVPYHRAMEIALLGERFSAADAHAYGLVNRLVPDGEALGTALDLARRICANGPLAVAASKQVLASAADWPPDERFLRQEALAAPVRGSADALEGAKAFLAKRPAVWSGS